MWYVILFPLLKDSEFLVVGSQLYPGHEQGHSARRDSTFSHGPEMDVKGGHPAAVMAVFSGVLLAFCGTLSH